MRVEVLHVADCPNTAAITGRLATLIAGRRDVTIAHRVIHDEAEAVARGMTGSPTLLVDGSDPFAAGQPASLSCRLYTDESGTVSGAPSLTQLRTVLAGAAHGLSSERRGPASAGIVTVIGIGLLAVLCCAGPALLAGGALAGIGGVLGNPWLLTLGAVLIVGGLIYTVVRRDERRVKRRNGADESCCAPPAEPKPGLDNSATQPHDPMPAERVEKRTR